MRTAIGAFALFVALLSVSGCDTDQPLQIDSQRVDLFITAPSAVVPLYATWVMYEDKNGNGISDDDYDGDGTADTFLWCEVPSSGRTTTATSSPWPFTLQVNVLRAGETVAEPITSASSISGDGNLAEYDFLETFGGVKPQLVVTHPRGTCSLEPEILCDPTSPGSIACASNGAGSCVDESLGGTVTVTRTFRFDNGRRLSGSNFELLSSVTNPLYELSAERTCPSANAGICIQSGTDAGTCDGNTSLSCDNVSKYPRCPGVDFGPAQIDGGTAPLSVDLANGDTIIVRARRLNSGPLGFNPLSQPGLSSFFLVDGQFVAVEGSTTQSANDPESSIDFFFTSR